MTEQLHKTCETCGTSIWTHISRCTNCYEIERRLEDYMKSPKGQDFVRQQLPKIDNWPEWDYEAVLRENKVKVVRVGDNWYNLSWYHGYESINTNDEVIARQSAAIFVSLWLRGFSASFADNLAHGYAMWLELQNGRYSVEVTKDLANAIIDMDNHGYSEGLGPETEKGFDAWDKLVMMAEYISDRKPDNRKIK